MGHNYYLSKSDFVVAHDCNTKLYYKKLKYPSANDDNEYLQHLAKGGYMVGKLATLLYPDGILIETGSDIRAAINLTKEQLKKDKVTLFEAAIESKGKLVRVDILEKNNNRINLIEVKSKSYDSTDDEKIKKKNERELEDYIVDVAYQYLVLTEALPEYKINPFLFLPDKAKSTKVEGLNLLFRIEEKEKEDNSRFRKYPVYFDESRSNDVLNDDIMVLVNVKERVLELQESLKEEVELLLKSLSNGVSKITVPLSKDCFKCEYSTTDETRQISGFHECWKNYETVDHHIKDLYHAGTIGGNKDPLVNHLIKQKKISLFDIPQSELSGKRGERQLIQILNTKENKEWISDDVKSKIGSWQYPLHFIDFENTLSALPFHKGMRPYEVVAFQWSCHTIERLGAEPKHYEWINVEPMFPNFEFAESLMKHIGTEGTFLMWATHENTILRTVYNQYDKYGYNNPELKEWLELVVKMDKDDSGLFVDMNRFTLEHYFHPMMKGKTSIKWTLPAVLSAFNSKRIENWLKNFEQGLSLFSKDDQDILINPYKLLPPIEIYEKAEALEDGTGAMRTYEDMMFGLRKGDAEAVEIYKKALLRYCKLDSLAMVIIWEHWNSIFIE
jgi:hypothetical protein